MELFIECSIASDINFQSSLFKMKTDQMGFETFEELFENHHEDAPGELSLKNEWRRCDVSNSIINSSFFFYTFQFQKQFLHSEQPGVFIVIADVLEFVGELSRALHFFLSYKVKSSILTAKLMLDLGEVDIDFQSFCVDKAAEMLGKRNDGGIGAFLISF